MYVIIKKSLVVNTLQRAHNIIKCPYGNNQLWQWGRAPLGFCHSLNSHDNVRRTWLVLFFNLVFVSRISWEKHLDLKQLLKMLRYVHQLAANVSHCSTGSEYSVKTMPKRAVRLKQNSQVMGRKKKWAERCSNVRWAQFFRVTGGEVQP